MTHLSWTAAVKLAVLWVVLSVVAGAFVPSLTAQQDASRFPAPRFPLLPKDPETVAEALPHARLTAANTVGLFGEGLGTAKAGETIVVVPSAADSPNPHILEALRQALVERKVRPIFLQVTPKGVSEWSYLGGRGTVTPPSVSRFADDGAQEVRSMWFPMFVRPNVPQTWLKNTRPDLYDRLYAKDDPKYQPTPESQQYGTAPEGALLQEYLRTHPEVDRLYWGGSWIYLAPSLGPFAAKWRGAAVFDRWRVMSQASSYPGDVWVLSEIKNQEALPFIDRVHLTDPEGTDISLEVSPELGRRWAKGAFERGHQHLGPNMATGRHARNAVSYPSLEDEWIPRGPLALWSGVVAGTVNHVGFYPKIEVHYTDGYVSKVVGGGTYGELMRTFLNYPEINTVTYPFHDRPGFYNLAEVALGTNPKYFRDPKAPGQPLNVTQERVRAGTLHFGVGTQLENDPTSKGRRSDVWQAFAAKHDVPFYHGWHVHAYFATYRVRLRNSDKWLAILDRGRMTSLDDPEVRALASRYGNADKILEDAWFPEIPGINAPGRFDDYAQNPGKYHRAQNDKIFSGTYEHLRP